MLETINEQQVEYLIPNIVNKLLSAARSEEWDIIDEKIIPEISRDYNNDGFTKELLKYANDENPNVRDVVATGLMAIDILNKELLKVAIKEMTVMAATDEEKFPAGRAALFLIKYKQESDNKDEIEVALNDFKNLVNSKNWAEELAENIPQLEGFINLNS